MTYTLSVFGQPSVPSFITFTPPNSVKIKSTSKNDALKPFVNMILTGTFTYPTGMKTTASLYLPLYLTVLNTGPPFFTTDLIDITMKMGD